MLVLLLTAYLVLVLPFVVLVGKGIARGARTDDLGTEALQTVPTLAEAAVPATLPEMA